MAKSIKTTSDDTQPTPRIDTSTNEKGKKVSEGVDEKNKNDNEIAATTVAEGKKRKQCYI